MSVFPNTKEVLSQKRSELVALEQQAQTEHTAYALEKTKEQFRSVFIRDYHTVINHFFAVRVTDVHVITAQKYTEFVENRGYGDKNEKKPIFVIENKFLKWKIMCHFLRTQKYGRLELCIGEEKPVRLRLYCATDIIQYQTTEFFINDCSKIISTLFGPEYVSSFIKDYSLVIGLFFGSMEAFLAKYIYTMRECPDESKRLIHSDLFLETFKHIYTGNQS